MQPERSEKLRAVSLNLNLLVLEKKSVLVLQIVWEKRAFYYPKRKIKGFQSTHRKNNSTGSRNCNGSTVVSQKKVISGPVHDLTRVHYVRSVV